jgi:transposase-like protein
MIIPHHFPVTIETYTVRGKKNDFPTFDCCPFCRAMNTLLRHGYYERNAIEDEVCHRITIFRLKCPDCRKTFSILPNFLLPYFQHTLSFMIRILLTLWSCGMQLCTRQRRFYKKRLDGKLTEIELFLRTLEHLEAFPQKRSEKEAAFLLLIQAMERTIFTHRWRQLAISSLLSHSLYRGSQVVLVY